MPMHDWTRVEAGIFHDFHSAWIAEMRKVLNQGLLPPSYYAMSEQEAGPFGPDVLTLEVPGGRDSDGAEDGGVAVEAVPPQVAMTATSDVARAARRRKVLAIRHRTDDRVVAIVEIVSPGNKNNRNGFRAFVRKAVDVLNGGVHLLIIDPHPPGKRDPEGIHGRIWSEIADDSFRLPSGKPLTLVSYTAGPVKTAYIQPFAVGDVLPAMPLFLTPEKYVPVPLEPTYAAAWEGTPRRWRDILTGALLNHGTK
jgi:hypothetical protein